MVRNYEIAFLLREGREKETIEAIKSYLEGLSANIENESDMGNRQLAYEIRKNRERFNRAFYYFLYLSIDPVNLPEFERKLKLNEDVIRYMVLLKK